MDVFTIFYEVLGGLGVFFYGMKGMSDSLQAAAGDVIKDIIASITRNRFLAVAVGTVVTMIVQSSSVTTVMVVGLVNAGLMSLTQAIGVIFGANIGTTITGWIISIKIGKYGLLLIGLGIFPALFAKSDRWKQIGRLFFSVGMAFFGLEIMSGAFKPLRKMPEFLDAISYFSGEHYGAYFASILIGCMLTMIIQSSSAMLGITMALASSGVINFHTAAALVLGENIGTTITALLASIGGNVNAKRAARAHALFNVFGVMVVFSIFPMYIHFVDWLVPGDPNLLNAAGERPDIAIHIATSHTLFNLTATLFCLPFVNVLASIVTKLTPEPKRKEQHHLVVLGNPSDILPATALIQAEAENEKFHAIVSKMFNLTKEYILAGGNQPKMLAKIKDYEQITDNIQKEITVFVCAVMERELSKEQSARAQVCVRVADELESVADYLEKLCIHFTRFMEGGKLENDVREEFLSFFEEVFQFHREMGDFIKRPDSVDMSYVDRKSEELRRSAEAIRVKHLSRVSSGSYDALSALTYSDMVVALRKIRSHSHNVGQALARVKYT